MTSDPSVYLLLRTHNRPEEFQRCIDSISEQSVMPEIIIISDDKNDNYINEVKLPHQIFRPLYKKPQWWKRHHNPFNDYFNQVLSIIPDGHFIYYLDDDDELVDTDWIKTILEEKTDLLIGRFQLGKSHNGKIIGKEAVRGKIGGSCIAVRSEIAREFKWPLIGAGDFFIISQIIKKYEPKFVSIVAGKVQRDLQHSWGARKSY